MDRWMHARQKLTLVYGESKINSYLIPPNTNFKSDGNVILCCLTVDMVEVCTEQRNSLIHIKL